VHAEVGDEFEFAITVKGARGFPVLELAGGTLPPGLSLGRGDHHPVVVGIPRATGTFSFKLRARDDLGRTSSAWFTWTIQERGALK
jgi:hypothetical protein